MIRPYSRRWLQAIRKYFSPARRKPAPKRRRLELEHLEDRTLMTINIVGAVGPNFTAEGPGQLDLGTDRLVPGNTNLARLAVPGDYVAGSISAVAVDPLNSQTLLAGATGGGIWRSTNGGQTWTPQTDQLGSLFISDIAFNPFNSNIVYASTGNNSASYPGNFTQFSTQADGILQSTDRGVTWTQLAIPAAFGGRRLTQVVPTADFDAGTGRQIILAAAMDGGGIYRSDDAGATWRSVLRGDPAGNTPSAFQFANFGADLIRDPQNNGTYFAAIPHGAVYRSIDDGNTWTNIDPAGSAIATDVSQSDRVLLALNSTASTFALYAEVIRSGHLVNLYRSTNARPVLPPPAGGQGAATWTAVANAQDPFLGGQGNLHGAILADPNNANVVYLSGDAIRPFPFTGIIYRVTAAGVGAGTWTPVTLYKASFATTLTRRALIADRNDVTVYVRGASAVPVSSVIQVDHELMQVTGRNTLQNTLTVTRGFNNTTIAAHVLDANGNGPEVVVTTTLVNNVAVPTMAAPATTLTVRYAANIPPNSIIQVDDELMRVTNVNATQNTLTVTRGILGTAAVFHFANFSGPNNSLIPNQVILITNGANNTGPHADSRVMVWNNGDILQGGDGGLFKLTQPTTNPTWSSLNGNIQTLQLNSVALDTANGNTVFGGAQDNSTEFQVNGTGTNWVASQESGDGALVAVDQTGTWHYVSTQTLGQFQRFQVTNNAGNVSMGSKAGDLDAAADITATATTLPVVIAASFLPNSIIRIDSEQMRVTVVNKTVHTLTVIRGVNGTVATTHAKNAPVIQVTHFLTLTNTANPDQIDTGGGDGGDGDSIQPAFTTTWALNNAASAQNDLIIGDQAGHLFESTNQGDKFTELLNAENRPVTFPGGITAIAYGGVSNNTDAPGVTYVGGANGNVGVRTGNVLTGEFIGGPLDPNSPLSVQAIAMDPTNWRIAVAVTQTQVWFTTDNGGSWTRITGNLTDKDLLSAAIVRVNGSEVILVGGSSGLYRSVTADAANLTPNTVSTAWSEFGQNLPNDPVSTVRYYGGTADTLLVGTYGRGAWTLANASTFLAVTPRQVQITDDNTVDLRRDPNNPQMLDVFENQGLVTGTTTTPNAILNLSSLAQITVNTTGANDGLFLDSTYGAFTDLGALPRITYTASGNRSSLSLVGRNQPATWNITGTDAGNIRGGVGSSAVRLPPIVSSFTNVSILNGSAAQDVFRFSPGGSVSGSINGNGGGDFLDYSAVQSSVVVNLATGSATGVNGAAAFLVSNIQNVIGSAVGGDRLTGSSLGSVLVAHRSGNRLVAGNARSILIGGSIGVGQAGMNTLTGGGAGDILIDGFTSYDDNPAALSALLAEWQSSGTYGQRIRNLRTGAGLAAGNSLLFGQTVFVNGPLSTSSLTGGAGGDWFFTTDALKIIKDLEMGEAVNDLGP
jgi:hypothetical protein